MTTQAPHSRDNHLGNAITDTIASASAHYNWTLPSAKDEPCIAAGNCRYATLGRICVCV